jgi:hypothetical protein
MIDDGKHAAAQLVGLCASKVRRWDEYARKAASANPSEMDAGKLRERVFDLQDLVMHACDEIRFLVGEYLHAMNCGPHVLH